MTINIILNYCIIFTTLNQWTDSPLAFTHSSSFLANDSTILSILVCSKLAQISLTFSFIYSADSNITIDSSFLNKFTCVWLSHWYQIRITTREVSSYCSIRTIAWDHQHDTWHCFIEKSDVTFNCCKYICFEVFLLLDVRLLPLNLNVWANVTTKVTTTRHL